MMRSLLSAILAIALAASPAWSYGGGAWGQGGGGTPGAQGPEGPPGPAGADGADGAPGAPGLSPNQITSGGGVSWTGSSFDFRVSATEYYIAGVAHTAPETVVALDDPDGSNDRIDVIAVDVNGDVVVLEGTPAATPIAPSVDVATQIKIAEVRVETGTTEPSFITTEDVYLNNAEWTASASGTGMSVSSVSGTCSGSACVEATSTGTTNTYFEFVAPSPFVVTEYNSLVFIIRSKAQWYANANNQNNGLTIQWKNGTTNKGSSIFFRQGTVGFDSANTTSYQQIVIPISTFAAEGQTVDRIRFTRAGNIGTAVGFYADDFILQGGLPTTITGTADLQWKGAWNATTSYAVNQVVTHGGGTYVALQSSTNVTPGTAAAIWTTLAPAAAATSAALRSQLSDESGTGAAIFAGGDIGVATATTPSADDSSTKVATTAFVQGEVAAAGGKSILTARTTGNVSNSATNYFAITGFSGPSATENDVILGMVAITPTELTCTTFGGSPGSGKSYAITVRRAAADTDWSCTIADANTSCSDTSGSAIALSGSWSFKVVPSGTPTAAAILCRFAFSVQ